MRDCVVELVGLEPTTKVLWNMVRVRPTPLVGHPCGSPGILLFCLIFLAFRYLSQPPECMEHGSSPTNYPGRTPIQIAYDWMDVVQLLICYRPNDLVLCDRPQMKLRPG